MANVTRENLRTKLKLNLRAWEEFRTRLNDNRFVIVQTRMIIESLKTGKEDLFEEPEFEHIIKLSRDLHNLKMARKELTEKCRFWKEKCIETKVYLNLGLFDGNESEQEGNNVPA